MSTENCTPEVPDVQSAVDKAIETAKGKVAAYDFRPVNFDMDISKFFTFDVFSKLLGKPGGLGYDMCEICGDSGTGVDGAIGNSPFPLGGEATIGALAGAISAVNDKVDNIEIPSIPDGTFSLDSAISILSEQIDSVSDVVDSAGI